MFLQRFIDETILLINPYFLFQIAL